MATMLTVWALCGATGYVWGLAHKSATYQRISAEDVFFGFLMIFMAGPIFLFMVYSEWRNDTKGTK